MLDVLGLAPGPGTLANGVNAGWYAREGRWTDALLSGIGAIPVVGAIGSLAKWGGHLVDALREGSRLVRETQGSVRIYERGLEGFEEAVRELERIGARNVREQEAGVVVGDLPDGSRAIARKFSGRQSGNRPTLEIQRPDGRPIDKFRY